MRIVVIGAGLVGRRSAVQLHGAGHDVTLASRARPIAPLDGVATLPGADGATLAEFDLAVLATDSMHQTELAESLLRRGTPVVATADQPRAVRSLWTLDDLARRNETFMIVGAACSPGLSTLLVDHLASAFDRIDAITTARFGTGGPSCAREHHRSMAAQSWEVRDGTGRWFRGGSGRSLVWFPEPAGPQDCYRAGLSEPFLLQQRFPDVPRIQSLQAATRRDRATARLPMLRPPHPEGLVGAVWAEVRGVLADGGGFAHRVLAASAPQATAAAATVNLVVSELENAAGGPATYEETVNNAQRPCGVHGVSWSKNATEMLRRLPPEVRLWTHAGDAVVRPPLDAPVHAARKWRGSREISTLLPITSIWSD